MRNIHTQFRLGLIAATVVFLLSLLTATLLPGCAVNPATGGATTQPVITPGTVSYAILNVENLGYMAAVSKATIQAAAGKLTPKQVADFEVWREADSAKISALIASSVRAGFISQAQADQLAADGATVDVAWSAVSVLRSTRFLPSSFDPRSHERKQFA